MCAEMSDLYTQKQNIHLYTETKYSFKHRATKDMHALSNSSKEPHKKAQTIIWNAVTVLCGQLDCDDDTS